MPVEKPAAARKNSSITPIDEEPDIFRLFLFYNDLFFKFLNIIQEFF